MVLCSFVGSLVGWLVGVIAWLVGWLVGWLVAWLVVPIWAHRRLGLAAAPLAGIAVCSLQVAMAGCHVATAVIGWWVGCCCCLGFCCRHVVLDVFRGRCWLVRPRLAHPGWVGVKMSFSTRVASLVPSSSICHFIVFRPLMDALVAPNQRSILAQASFVPIRRVRHAIELDRVQNLRLRRRHRCRRVVHLRPRAPNSTPCFAP